MMMIGNGAAFLTSATRAAHVVASIEVDGLAYETLDNGAIRVADVDSLGILSIVKYPNDAARDAAFEAMVAEARAAA